MMNRAIFAHVKVGEDLEIAGTTLTPIYAALSAWQPGLGQPAPSHAEGQKRLGKAKFQPVPAPVHYGRWRYSVSA
jgi:hypothetical protein